MVGRRGFLKAVGAALITAVAAPAFIPAERLDFGVPKLILPPEPALVPEPFHLSQFVLDEPSYVEHRQALLDVLESPSSFVPEPAAASGAWDRAFFDETDEVCAADDTARLQAMLDRGGHIDLSGETFYVSEPVRIRVDGTYLENAHVVYTRPVPALVSMEGQNQTLVNSHFIGHRGGVGSGQAGIRVLTGTIEPHRPVRVEHGLDSGDFKRLHSAEWPSFSMRPEQPRVVPLAGETLHLSYLEEVQRLPDDWVATLLRAHG